MKPVKVSIVIVNYKTANLIVNSIKSIQQYTAEIDYETIVVDNDSQDGIDKILQNKFGNSVRCICLNKNMGFGLANNIGFENANGEYLFCLNPDTLLLNNAIKILSDYMDNNPKVGACGGNIYDKDRKPTFSFYPVLPGIKYELYELGLQRFAKYWLKGNLSHNFSANPLDVGYIIGADLMLRRSTINEVGTFSKDFFLFFEETDLCCRIKDAGWRVVSIPQAKIQHLEGSSFNTVNDEVPFRYVMLEKSRKIYMEKHANHIKRKVCSFIEDITLFVHSNLRRMLGDKSYIIYHYRRKAKKEV